MDLDLAGTVVMLYILLPSLSFRFVTYTIKEYRAVNTTTTIHKEYSRVSMLPPVYYVRKPQKMMNVL